MGLVEALIFAFQYLKHWQHYLAYKKSKEKQARTPQRDKVLSQTTCIVGTDFPPHPPL